MLKIFNEINKKLYCLEVRGINATVFVLNLNISLYTSIIVFWFLEFGTVLIIILYTIRSVLRFNDLCDTS